MKNALLGLLLLTYPFAVYFGLSYFEPAILAVFFALIFLLRHLNQTRNKPKSGIQIPHLKVLLIAVLSLLAYTYFANSALALKFYPVVVSVSFLIIFVYSLIRPPSVVEMIARLHEKLDQDGVIYTRKVTWVWCVFFVTNAAIATWTIFHPDPDFWLIYNGMIAYILMGTLMGVEILYRKFSKTRAKQLTEKQLRTPTKK